MGIITLADIKRRMGFKESESASDVLLQRFIDETTTEIEERIGYPVIATEAEDVLDGTGQSHIFLSTGRIISLVGVDETARLANLQYRNTVSEGWVNLLTDEDLIQINPRNNWMIQLLDGTIFPVGVGNIRVEYNCGFASIPGDIVNMAAEMIQIRWNRSKQGDNTLGQTSQSVSAGAGSVNVGIKDMDPEWKVVIDRYRRIGV